MTDRAAKPLLKLDKRAKKLFAPHRNSPAVKVLDWLGNAGDQPQLRLLCTGVVAAGLVRGDSRMMGAGVRMLLAHELATFAKDTVKRRIDRTRPRSTPGPNASKPSKGGPSGKELSSFPSGHSAGSVAVACAFGAVYPEYRPYALGAAGAIAIAQVPTCAHYPSDVAAGSLIGAAANALVGWTGRAFAVLMRS